MFVPFSRYNGFEYFPSLMLRRAMQDACHMTADGLVEHHPAIKGRDRDLTSPPGHWYFYKLQHKYERFEL